MTDFQFTQDKFFIKKTLKSCKQALNRVSTVITLSLFHRHFCGLPGDFDLFNPTYLLKIHYSCFAHSTKIRDCVWWRPARRLLSRNIGPLLPFPPVQISRQLVAAVLKMNEVSISLSGNFCCWCLFLQFGSFSFSTVLLTQIFILLRITLNVFIHVFH